MKPICFGLVWVLLCVEASWAEAANSLVPAKKSEPTPTASIPWQELSERCRSLVRVVVDKPLLAARGPAETFTCHPEHYYWLLDHPDRAVTAWRRLGARCTSI